MEGKETKIRAKALLYTSLSRAGVESPAEILSLSFGPREILAHPHCTFPHFASLSGMEEI